MKRYTFADCVKYASKHGIQFDVRMRDGYLYDGLWIVISDAYDGYCSSENVEFIPELNDSVRCSITPSVVRTAIDNARGVTPEHSDYFIPRDANNDEIVIDFYDDSRYYHNNVWR